MQATKDSFFAFLRNRLAELDAEATTVVGGVVRPAVLVDENESPGVSDSMPGVFCLEWGVPQPTTVATRRRVLHGMPVQICYAEEGTAEMSGADRGRRLGLMDTRLRRMLAGGNTAKIDYTQSPAVDLGTKLMWSDPEFEAAEQSGKRLVRTAKVTVYFYPEVSE